MNLKPVCNYLVFLASIVANELDTPLRLPAIKYSVFRQKIQCHQSLYVAGITRVVATLLRYLFPSQVAVFTHLLACNSRYNAIFALPVT